MLSVNKFFEKISYQEIVASIVEVMAENFEDFAADQVRFKETISWFEEESCCVDELVDAIDRRIGSMVLFSYFLGLKANWDHFMDPIAQTFLDVDADVYLREDMARRLPDYQRAQDIQERFFAALTPVQRDRYENVTGYVCHLETLGPKLAHYYGYLLGNQLFPHIVPGYGEDVQFTLRYRHILLNYCGVANYHSKYSTTKI